MARRPVKKQWGELRDWLNVAVAGAALLVAIVSVWTTTQISGLEDYFRSEIGRRNAELNSLSGRAATFERMANTSAGQLSQLQASTALAISSSLRAQQQLIQSQGELSAVRSNVLSARQELALARGEASAIRTNYAAQAREFDLLRRQQAFEHASLTVAFAAYNWSDDSDSEESSSDASSVAAAIRDLQPPPHTIGFGPHLERIKGRFDRFCPNMATWQSTVPARPQPPAQPTISYRQGTSQARIAELTREAQDRWSAAFNEYARRSQEHSSALITERQRLANRARSCVCSSRSDEQFSRQDICPSS